MINQKDYLKKYLSSGDSQDKKKKKKKKLKVGTKTVKIIDDDIDVNNIKPLDDDEFGIFIDNEDAPQIVGIVDERGPVDFADKKRWRIIADDGEEDIAFASGDKVFKYKDKEQDSNEYKKRKKHKTSELRDDKTEETDRKQCSDSDMSPPRQKGGRGNVEKSPPRRRKKDKNSDLSPPRRKAKNDDSDISPPRQRRKDDDSDLSPPGRKGKNYDSDLSPPRRNGKNDDSDLSPRRRGGKHDDSDLSPPRMRGKDIDSDLSPPRRRKRDNEHQMSSSQRSKRSADGGFSPSRHTRHHNRKSRSPRPGNSRHHGSSHTKYSDKESRHKRSDKRSRWSTNDDEDLPRRRKDLDVDQHSSHVDSKRHRSDHHHVRGEKSSSERRKDPSSPEPRERMKKTLDGKTAGLQDAKALREETDAYKRREAEHFRKLSKEVTGVGQAAIVRDTKTGRKRNLEAEAAEEREKEERQQELNEKYAKWGKGLKQVEDNAEKLKDDLYEMSKPLARYADDADLDKRLREQERDGDPMLEYIKQKQIKEGKRKPDQPQYEGSYMPNRFGIKPGHRWDGVDRSNGYEKKWFDAQNAKVARQEEAYKWSTADM